MSASNTVGRIIVPIVEGQSEVHSIGVLIRRMLHDLNEYSVEVTRPFRVKRQKVVRVGELERSIEMAQQSREGATALMIILDADRDCPVELSSELRARASAISDLDVAVVHPKVEIEAWVLAGIESVRGIRGVRHDATPPPDVEAMIDAKGAISRLMVGPSGYVATSDLPAFFAKLDLSLVESRSPSFLKFKRDIASLAREVAGG